MNNDEWDPQEKLISLIKQKIGKEDSIGLLIADVLNVSKDAAYRRLRGDMAISIHELGLLSRHFDISLDKLFDVAQKSVSFDYLSLDESTFSLEDYLNSIRNSLLNLKSKKNPALILTINNTPFFQLLNFPELVRFKLFFWMKNHLQLKQYRDTDYANFRFTAEENNIISEILQLYINIPTTEVYDQDLMQGFAREVQFYEESHFFSGSNESKVLFENIELLIEHLNQQAMNSEKFKVNTPPCGRKGNLIFYFNETLNSVASFYYSSDQDDGLYVAHNFLNSLHTTNKNYLRDTKLVIDRMVLNSSRISESSSKERNKFFGHLRSKLASYQRKID